MDQKVVGMSNYPSVNLSIHPSIHLSILLFSLLIYLPVNLSISLSLFPSICLALYLSMQPSIHHPISVSAIFLVYVSKVLRLPRKIDARSYEVLHLPRKNILANLQIWCFKRQLLSRNLMNMSLVLRLPREMHLCRSSANLPRLPSFLEMPQNLTFCTLLARCRIPCAYHAKPHLNLQRRSEHVVFWTFWLWNVLRALFDISASKSGLNVVCFVHFDFERCFVPQRRALFQHLNFQK